MARALAWALAGVAVLAAPLAAQDGIRKGVLKKVDPEKGVVVITADGKDLEFAVTDGTRVFGSKGRDVKERLADLRAGTPVFFKGERRDGKDLLIGIKPEEPGGAPDRPLPRVDTSKLKPLTEAGKEEYKGFPGGLYPEGRNERPAAHEAAGLKLATAVRPLDGEGKAAPDGKIVLLSVGMSNTTQEFSAFKRLADADGDKNPHLTIVDGAQGGMTAFRIMDPESDSGRKFWGTVDQRLENAGATRAQVQAAWIKEADAGPREGFPQYARTLQGELGRIVRLMKGRFPNLKLVYLSSRTYGGYAKTLLNPEPYAYESGYSVKWLIEQQIKGEASLNYDPEKGAVKAPWLSWGPYLWANGTTKRADGFSYEESDFGGDGTHPSAAGQRKVAELLLKFFKEDATTKKWFVKQ
jgi:hypothetical protein